jgi:hypothetical protein
MASGRRTASKGRTHGCADQCCKREEALTNTDLEKVDIVGVFPNYATAYAAWKAEAQKTVDNALMRYFIVHMHRLLDPATDVTRQKA